MMLKWTFAIPALAAGALLVATAVVPSGPAEAASKEAKCRAYAKKTSPGQNAQARRTRGLLYQSCMAKG